MSGRRHRLVRLALVAAMVLPIAWTWLARSAAPSDGTLTYPSNPPWSSSQGVGITQVYGSGDSGCLHAHAHDRVTTVDAVDLEAWVRGSAERPVPQVGDRVTYGGTRSVKAGTTAWSCPVTLRAYPFLDVALAHVAPILLIVLMWAIAAYVFRRRPRDPAARALFLIAAIVPFGAPAWPFGLQVVDLTSGPRLWPYVTGEVANALLWGAVLQFGTVFPRPLPLLARRPWLRVAPIVLPFLLYVVAVAVGYVRDGHSLAPSAVGTPPGLGELRHLLPVSVTAARVVPLLMIVVLVWQYRATTDADERRRLRWVTVSFLLAATVYLALGQLPDLLHGAPSITWDWITVVFAIVPVTLGAAVLRFGLFDIQVILRRSVVYGLLTASLVLVPAAGAVLAVRLIGAHPTALELTLLAALAVFVALQAFRGRLKRRLSRLIFGERDDPYEVVSRIGRDLQGDLAPESLLPQLAETLAHALRLSYVRIELFASDVLVDAESYGTPEGEVLELPLVARGEHVGRLLIDAGARRESFGPADQRLIELLAQQVGLAAHRVLLTGRLQRSLHRAVTAREEERRRLRRDIHDGLGPMLAATKLQLELALAMIDRKPATTAALLESLKETQQQVLKDIRRLVDGLRPPVLDQLGLVAAVRAHADGLARSGDETAELLVDVDAATDLGPLPAAVEVAAYRVALEALTNVVRHARAHRCDIRLWRTREALLLDVHDDGEGLPPNYRAGVGLVSMRERATELGGTCVIGPSPTGGTLVQARFPTATG